MEMLGTIKRLGNALKLAFAKTQKKAKIIVKPIESRGYSIYEETPSIHLKAIDGSDVNIQHYKGKKLLIVNTASECGYTYQYEGLVKLQTEFKDNLVVLAFPANNFLNQEPGTNAEIASFCAVNYQTNFPLFQKISVLAPNQHPIYVWLSDISRNGWCKQLPEWNFSKYYLDERGILKAYFDSNVEPTSDMLLQTLGLKTTSTE